MRNAHLFKLLITTFITILFFSPALARNIGYMDDPLVVGVGARAMGLGRAAVAVVNDENSIFVNPAGLGEVKTLSLTSMFSSLLGGDVNYIVTGVSTPFLKKTTLGIGYLDSTTGGIITGSQEGFLYSDYSSKVMLVGLGGQLTPQILLGSSLKLFTQGFSGQLNYVGTGMDIDLGIKYNPKPWFSFGLNLKNILPASMGGKVVWPNGDIADIPAIAKAGFCIQRTNPDILLSYDYDIELDRTFYPNLSHLGVEWQVDPVIALRGGLDQNVSARTMGAEISPALGLGLNLSNLKVEYAYHPDFAEAANVTHFISLGYLAPSPKSTPITPEAIIATVSKEAVAFKFPQITRYKVQRGDTLPLLGIKFFGDAEAAKDLATFNDLKKPYTILVGNTLLIPPFRLKKFTDIPMASSYAKTAGYLGSLGIMGPDAKGKFLLDKKLNRVEVITVIIRTQKIYAAESKMTDSRFRDVSPFKWYYPYVVLAQERGILDGYPEYLRPSWIPNEREINILFMRAGIDVKTIGVRKIDIAEAIFNHILSQSQQEVK